MHDTTSTLPIVVNPPLGGNAKWPPHVNRRRAPVVIWLGFTGYAISCQSRPYVNDYHKSTLACANGCILYHVIYFANIEQSCNTMVVSSAIRVPARVSV